MRAGRSSSFRDGLLDESFCALIKEASRFGQDLVDGDGLHAHVVAAGREAVIEHVNAGAACQILPDHVRTFTSGQNTSGVSGPKRTMLSMPVIDAKCPGPLSFVISKSASV